MKRKALQTAVLAGIAGVAGIANISQAVNLNPDGLGQVLLYPYYTVNGGNDTLMSVVNTTDQVKAVKVRFLESKNTREVLDFNLYLSPFDVWTAALTSDSADGEMLVLTADTSCTVPIIDGVQGTGSQREGTINGVPFVGASTIRLNEFTGVDSSDARTREGHFEIIEMGVIEEAHDADATGLEAAATHGATQDCGLLQSAWVPGGVWNATGSQQASTDVTPPTGGLFGGASIINVDQGTQVSYNADAIDAFFAPGDGESTLHANPGTEAPSLQDAQTGTAADPVQSIVFDNGAIVTSTWDPTTAEDAVSAVYMHNQIFNEYAIDSALNGATEWVVTFPTKRFYVDTDPARLPFTAPFDGSQVATGAACEPIGLAFWNREEAAPGQTPGEVNFSPFDPTSPNVPVLCFESQVVTFGQDLAANPTSAIFGSPNARNIAVDAAGFENGWARIDFTSNLADPADHTLTGLGGDVYAGLPATGFSATVVQNGALASGTLANYAGSSRHRASRSVIDVSPNP